MATKEEDKEKRREEYAAAEAFVCSVYEKSPPPYDEDYLLDRVQSLAKGLDRRWLRWILKRLNQENPEIHVRPRTKEEWDATFPRYPVVSPEGYVQSFQPQEYDAIQTMLDKYGLVVVQAFDEEQCQATIDAMFEEINQLATAASNSNPTSSREAIHPNKPWTWEDHQWPSTHKKFLIRQPAFHLQAFQNRVSPPIYELFARLCNERKLRVSIDNWGVVRGSKNLLLRQSSHINKEGNAQLIIATDRHSWGKGIAPHWDYNPWLFVDEVKGGRNPGYQAVVALNDHSPGMGCHQTLPGGTAFLEQWCKEHGCPTKLRKKRSSHRPPIDDSIRSYMQEIPLRQGEMIIWSWGQLHATGHNSSNTMRLHQYIRMFPASSVDPFYEEHDRYAPRRVMRNYEDVLDLNLLRASLNTLGRRLVGLEEWPLEEDAVDR